MLLNSFVNGIKYLLKKIGDLLVIGPYFTHKTNIICIHPTTSIAIYSYFSFEIEPSRGNKMVILKGQIGLLMYSNENHENL